MRWSLVSSSCAVFLVLAAFATTSSVRAESYFVSPSGNNSATGLAGSPWRQPQEALDHALPGDTITVEDGTYEEINCDGEISGNAGNLITFRARNRWGAHIVSSALQDGINLVGCSYIVIDGFEVSGATRAGIRVGGIVADGSDARGVVVRNNWCHDNGASTAGGNDGILTGFALDVLIEGNLVHDSGEHGIYVGNSADNPIIRNNTVYASGRNCIQINADDGQLGGDDGEITQWVIEGNVLSDCNGSFALNLDGVANGIARNNVIFGAPNSGGITFFQGDGTNASHDNVVVNNSIFNPGCDNAALQIADGADDNVAFNNILICSTNESGIEVQAASGFQHDYNIVSGYSGTTASAHETTLTGAAALALFTSASDLHLPAGSAAINAGIGTYAGNTAPALDVENHPRPQESGFDIGAYEFGNAPAVDGGLPPPGGGTPGGGSGGCGCTVPGQGARSEGLGAALLLLACFFARRAQGSVSRIVRKRASFSSERKKTRVRPEMSHVICDCRSEDTFK